MPRQCTRLHLIPEQHGQMSRNSMGIQHSDAPVKIRPLSSQETVHLKMVQQPRMSRYTSSIDLLISNTVVGLQVCYMSIWVGLPSQVPFISDVVRYSLHCLRKPNQCLLLEPVTRANWSHCAHQKVPLCMQWLLNSDSVGPHHGAPIMHVRITVHVETAPRDKRCVSKHLLDGMQITTNPCMFGSLSMWEKLKEPADFRFPQNAKTTVVWILTIE